MASTTVGTGTLGSTWTAACDLVSQDQASNTSVVRVRGTIYNNSTVTSYNNNAISHTISGSGSWSAASGISVPGKTSATIIDQNFTIGHDANGYASVSFAVAFGDTGTSGLGGPTSATVSMDLPRIPKAPSAPYGYSARNVTSTDAYTTAISVADDGGAALDNLQAEVNTSQSDTGASFAVAGGVVDPHMTGLAAATPYWFRVAAHNAIGWSAWGGWVSFTTQPNPPAAPTGATLARNSDTSFTVGWTDNATAQAPYANVVVQRQADGGSWATVATLAGSATSYTDTTTSANHTYVYQVYATNSAGSSTSAGTSALATTPAAPSSVSAARGTGGSVNLTWANGSTPDYQTVIEGSDGSGGWTAKATVAAGVTAWTDTAPLAGSTSYQLHAVATVAPGLSSAFVTSNAVVAVVAPNAPSGLSAGPVIDATEAAVFSWTHNPVDGSAQTQYQVQYRLVGGSWTTPAAVVSGTSSWTMPAGTLSNGHTYEWQVRTWGAATTGGSDSTGASPWSASASLTTSTRPTATISSPSSTVTTSAVSVAWTYYDAESTAQAAWVARLLAADGTVLEALSGSGATTSATFATTVTNGSAYTTTVSVQDGSGLWSTGPGVGSQAFTVSYAHPPVPTLTTSWDPSTATVTVSIHNPPPGAGEVATDRVNLSRSVDGGAFEVIAANVPPNTTLSDPAASVAGTNAYRVEAVSTLPSSSWSTNVDQVTSTDSVWVNGGPGFAQGCSARYDLALTVSGGAADKVLRQFAGRTLPVEFAGIAVARDLALSAVIPIGVSDASSADEWMALSDLPGPHLWRDPSGRRMVVSLAQVSATRAIGGQMTNLSVKATEIDNG